MERRTAIKNVLFAAAGIITLPAWGNSWNSHSLQITNSVFNANQVQTLEILVDSLIPSSSILGAKDLEISIFVDKMITDCYEKSEQNNFITGLENAAKLANETYRKDLILCDKTQRNDLLIKLSTSNDSQQKDFFTLLKSLTVLAYTTSEYVLTKHYNYVMAPGHYYGCVNV
ncbi:hypothetical protein EMA8858_01295 [Emticicia aquatica]|jgi:hypothetical protein|uniref:Gluconate 2-dehydrogenase subunit 3 family protein n=1 Tax=Emticicia aquatica TaxID=1681835 RepID=A0ABM9APG6_9BACT|nr:gluconate 2-dehydrogenase subunit 3 family protein [Emticicia aquatica]CAH0995175.1 hypothetical protein EMA8858_01295 [Emticicia aquatica]